MLDSDHDISDRKPPSSGAERIRRMRQRLRDQSAPSPAQFGRMLRVVVIENAGNDNLTPARALALTRDRLARRFSVDGINTVIARMAGEAAS